jgi:hypothetical protein
VIAQESNSLRRAANRFLKRIEIAAAALDPLACLTHDFFEPFVWLSSQSPCDLRLSQRAGFLDQFVTAVRDRNEPPLITSMRSHIKDTAATSIPAIASPTTANPTPSPSPEERRTKKRPHYWSRFCYYPLWRRRNRTRVRGRPVDLSNRGTCPTPTDAWPLGLVPRLRDLDMHSRAQPFSFSCHPLLQKEPELGKPEPHQAHQPSGRM